MKKKFKMILYIVLAIIVIAGITVAFHPVDTLISSDHSFTLLRPKIGEIVYLTDRPSQNK